MKLCYMYDEAFTPLRNNFLANLKDEFELIELKLNKPQFQSDAHLADLFGGGIDVWLEKPKYLLRTIERCQPNEYFVYSDIDIVFFKPMLPKLNELLKDQDVLFLREIPEGLHPHQGGTNIAGNCNFGFCVIKACERSKQFFLDVLHMIEQTRLMDQTIVNKILFGNPNYNLNWGVLPIEFTTTSFIHTKQLDCNSIMFHAICCVEQQEKLNLLAHAQSIVTKSVETCA